MVLFLFNEVDELTLEELKQATNIEVRLFLFALLPMQYNFKVSEF